MNQNNELAHILSNLERDVSLMEDIIENVARMNHAMFRAYVNSGFTEEQAIELTKVHGINLNQKQD